VKGSVIDERDEKEVRRYEVFPGGIEVEISVRQRSIAVSSEVRTEAEMGKRSE